MTAVRAVPIAGSGVVLLGGTAGVGLETAAAFAEAGARVIVLGRDAERGRLAVEYVRGRAHDAALAFEPVDASDPAQVERVVGRCHEQLGAIDTLVCSTGPSSPPRLLHTIAITDIRARIDEIVLPPLHLIHAVLPIMRAWNGGAIIAVASDAAKSATPGETLIGAAMAAITMFGKAAAVEAKREGVRINVLTPSLIAGTPGATLIAGEPFSDKMFRKAASMAHLGVVESADLAAMTLFLAGPAAHKITGQTISINGGISVV